MKTTMTAFALLISAAALPVQAEPLRIITTTTDLAYFARRVGGERITVEPLLRGSQDPHRIEARPDFILKVSKADGFIESGMDLESGWSPVLIVQSRNPAVQRDKPGYCDASRGVRVLEKPERPVDRSGGDVHAFGNPHYHTDPLNALIASRNIRDMLVRIDPGGRSEYLRNFEAFARDLKRLTQEESARFAALRGMRVAVYHREFVYFSTRFGIKEEASIEEKPGVPPSAAYMRQVSERLKAANVKLIIRAPWNPSGAAETVAERIGGKVVVVPVSVGSGPGTETYEELIRTMGRILREAAANP